MTLLGERLLGARAASAAAAPARWFDQRHKRSFWNEIAVGPGGRGLFEDSPVQKQQTHSQGQIAQEEKPMHKVSGIGKFLELGGVVQGSARGPRWFALPGSWRAPRIQIMRKHDPMQSAVVDERRTARMLTPADGRW